MSVDTHPGAEGDHFLALITRVKEEFLSQPTDQSDQESNPITLSIVATETLEELSDDEKLAVMSDLLVKNKGFYLGNRDQILEHADTPGSALFDVVRASVIQVLQRDSSLREEDERRVQAEEQAKEDD
jgi:hypothetical protein